MRIGQGHVWGIETAGWAIETDETCLTLTPADVGAALQFSAYRKKAGPVTRRELRAGLLERAPAGTPVEAVACGPFAGYRCEYTADGKFWRAWELARGRTELFVTYLTDPEGADRHRAVVDWMLSTLTAGRARAEAPRAAPAGEIRIRRPRRTGRRLAPGQKAADRKRRTAAAKAAATRRRQAGGRPAAAARKKAAAGGRPADVVRRSALFRSLAAAHRGVEVWEDHGYRKGGWSYWWIVSEPAPGSSRQLAYVRCRDGRLERQTYDADGDALWVPAE